MIASNTTPLIYLAKINRLELLHKLFDKIIISEEVKKEVVDEGKKRGSHDAAIVEQAILAGWITVHKTEILEMPIPIDVGEQATLSLAKKNKTTTVLIDEISARTAAKLLGLTPRGTVFVLLEALKKKIIMQDEFLEILRQLAQEGFRLKEEIYLAALEQARRFRQ